MTTATAVMRQIEKLGRLATHPDMAVAKIAMQKLRAVASGTYITDAGDAAAAKAQAILDRVG